MSRAAYAVVYEGWWNEETRRLEHREPWVLLDTIRAYKREVWESAFREWAWRWQREHGLQLEGREFADLPRAAKERYLRARGIRVRRIRVQVERPPAALKRGARDA